MIYTGSDEIRGIMLGGDEISAIYAGSEQIYPMDFGNLTAITFENLVWKTDVPYSGGTADKDNCSYKVIGEYDSGKSRSITGKATITGSLSVSATTSTTRVDAGQLTLTATYEGFTATGSVEAYQEANHYEQYMTMIITGPGKIVWWASGPSHTKTMQYSLDSGSTWTSITSANDANNGFDVVAGDVVMFKGENAQYGEPTGATTGAATYYNCFTNTTAAFVIEGNIMSMIYGDNFAGQTTLPSSHTFAGWLQNIEGLEGAENLILPATTMTPFCYRNFFATCGNIPLPKLPATTLARGCYMNMFINNSLEIAPDLLAPTLVASCYEGMFHTSKQTLKYIKCLAQNISASNCTTNFHSASGFAANGTFVKYPGVNWRTSSGNTNGIPYGWTIIEATE